MQRFYDAQFGQLGVMPFTDPPKWEKPPANDTTLVCWSSCREGHTYTSGCALEPRHDMHWHQPRG